LTFNGVPTSQVVFPNIKEPNGGGHIDIGTAVNVDSESGTEVGEAVADSGEQGVAPIP